MIRAKIPGLAQDHELFFPGHFCKPTHLIKDKKASIRWQDSARRQFQAGLRGYIGL